MSFFDTDRINYHLRDKYICIVQALQEIWSSQVFCCYGYCWLGDEASQYVHETYMYLLANTQTQWQPTDSSYFPHVQILENLLTVKMYAPFVSSFWLAVSRLPASMTTVVVLSP